jgi:hypothetical protein
MIQTKKTISQKLMVRACVSIKGVIGLYFYPPKTKINQHLYTDNCLEWFYSELEHNENLNKSDLWFKNDNARPHITAKVQNFLRQKFGHMFIGVGVTVPLSACSSDLTIPDFFLWEYLKDRGYAHSIANIQDLQQCIRIGVNKINNNPTLLRNMYNSYYCDD